MSTYTISSIKENRIFNPFMESNKRVYSSNLKRKDSKSKIALNNNYIIINNTPVEIKKNSLSSSQSS